MGFFSETTLGNFEGNQSKYIVAAKIYSGLIQKIFGANGWVSYYLYSAFVTTLDPADPLIWELYRQRAEAETQIRELKENYGLDGFYCEEFAATEAAFRWVCVAYNLMSLCKIALINFKHDPTLAMLML